jgi:hypothetical protein
MNPRINTLLRYVDPQGRIRGVLAVLTNQVMLGGQLVAMYGDTDVVQLQTTTSAPLPQRVAYVDFFHAATERYQPIGTMPDAATRALGQIAPGVPAIKTKVLLEPIDRLGRHSGDYTFDSEWTTADIMSRVDSGELSIVPVFIDDFGGVELESESDQELRNLQAKQNEAIAREQYYFAISPYDQPFTMLEVVPATRASRLGGIPEVRRESINVDLIWD